MSASEIVRILRQAKAEGRSPEEFRYFLYFPSEADAEAAAAVIRGAGSDPAPVFSTDVRASDGGAEWLCLVTRVLVNGEGLAPLFEGRDAFASLARKHRGRFDGWEMSLGPPRR